MVALGPVHLHVVVLPARVPTGFISPDRTVGVTELEIAPDPLSVDLVEGGIVVTYHDGRDVFYRGIPERVGTSYTTDPGREIHLLVTDGDTGRLVYVDERMTDPAILDHAGVGRARLSVEDPTPVLPGVSAHKTGLRIEFTVTPDELRGTAFVFEQDQFGERSVELSPTDGTGDSI